MTTYYEKMASRNSKVFQTIMLARIVRHGDKQWKEQDVCAIGHSKICSLFGCITYIMLLTTKHTSIKVTWM